MSQSTEQTAKAAGSPRRRRSRFQKFMLGFLGVLCIVGLVLGVIVWKLTTEPQAWRDARQSVAEMSNADLIENVVAVERKIAQLSHTVAPATLDRAATGADATPTHVSSSASAGEVIDPLAPREMTIDLSFEELNSWLAVKFEDWCANQGIAIPSQCSDFTLWSEGDSLVLAFEAAASDLTGVVSLVMDVEVIDETQCRLAVVSARGGEMPIPAERLLAHFGEDYDPDMMEKLTAAFDGLTFEPVWRMDKARRGRLLGLEVKPDGLVVTARSEPIDAPASLPQTAAVK